MAAEQVPRYIVVEGPIGVGKTTLARRLAERLGGVAVLEDARANPFLARFYEDPDKAALPAQLYFLFQRVQQVQQMRQGDPFRPLRVADFMLEKDRLFAETVLAPEELGLYERVYEQVAIEPPVPDLVVYLQAPVPVLLARIAGRGIAYERRIGDGYLARLVDAHVSFFHHYDAAPLLIVNAADIDLARSDRALELLVGQLPLACTGRHYFNPAAA